MDFHSFTSLLRVIVDIIIDAPSQTRLIVRVCVAPSRCSDYTLKKCTSNDPTTVYNSVRRPYAPCTRRVIAYEKNLPVVTINTFFRLRQNERYRVHLGLSVRYAASSTIFFTERFCRSILQAIFFKHRRDRTRFAPFRAENRYAFAKLIHHCWLCTIRFSIFVPS